MHRSTTLFLVLILGLFGIACSSGHGTTNPVTPGLTSAGPTVSAQANLIERDLWGWWNVAIDTATGEVEFAPFREAMFRANVTQWLQPPIGSYTNLKIIVDDMSTYFDDGRITVDVALTHPFPGFVEYTGFDVQGVFIHDGPVSDTYDPDINYAIRAETLPFSKTPTVTPAGLIFPNSMAESPSSDGPPADSEIFPLRRQTSILTNISVMSLAPRTTSSISPRATSSFGVSSPMA